MAGKQTFTEQDYISQRDALDQQIRVAEDDHHRAGYQQALGETTQDDVDKALVTLDALKNRRRSLDAAWAEAQRLANEAASADYVRRQDQAIAEIDGLLESRIASAAKMVEAAKVLASMFREYSQAGSDIRSAAHTLYSMSPDRLSSDVFGMLQSAIANGNELSLLAGLLAKEGLSFSNVHGGSARFEYDRRGGLVTAVSESNIKIRQRAVSLCPGRNASA